MVRKLHFLEYRLLTQHYPERTRGSPPGTQVGVHTLPIPLVGCHWSPLAEECGSKNLTFWLKMCTLLLLAAYRSQVFENDHFPDLVRTAPANWGDPSGVYAGATTLHTPMAAMVLGRRGSCGAQCWRFFPKSKNK